jgi:CubicO group peptidase (beta-lactamase class C family)
MNYKNKYLKYKTKYLELKNINHINNNNNNMIGGGKNKFKIITDKPKLKYVKYYGKNTIHTTNTIDNEILNECSEFMIGSITKLFTGMMIVILSSEKMLNPNDNVNKYIKPNANNKFENVTINNLLNHTGGIIWYLTWSDIPNKYFQVNTSTEALEIFMEKPLCTGDIGVKKYSSMGYIILGAIIEKVTRLSYMQALKKYIFDPCKMTNTNIAEPNTTMYNNGIPMENSKIKEQQMEKYMVNAGGGLYSCIADMVNFAIHIPKILTP